MAARLGHGVVVDSDRKPDCLPKPSMTVTIGAVVWLNSGSSVRMVKVPADEVAKEVRDPSVRCVMRALTPG